MILYIEKQAKDYKQTKRIIDKYNDDKWENTIIYIDNYKNIFDKKLASNNLEKAIIIAKLDSNAVTKAPKSYWYIDDSYFFKTSLNCVFDCQYCFLNWAFKSDYQVYFINYEDIKQQIFDLNNWELKWFYSSDYSDILWMNWLSNFIEEFVPFFEKQNNTMMEIRTKSANIKSILNLWFVPQNTEFAFSLNPSDLIKKYEIGTASLDERIKSINILIEKWYKVWLRFLPLLPVDNYQEIYLKFVQEIKWKIDFSKIHSTFASGLLYTKDDYNVILKKYPKLDILYRLKLDKNKGNPEWDKTVFVRESREMRDFFYKLFKDIDKKCYICLDS